MTFRPSCGTVPGAVAHQDSGEPLCGWCSMGGSGWPFSAAGLAAPGYYPPVTPAQAAMNAALLDAEVRAYEVSHGQRVQRPRAA